MKDGHAAPTVQERTEAAIDLENSFLRPRGRGFQIKLHKSFPRQRVGALTKILQHRHGAVCDTDDAETYFDLVVPFLVRASAIENGSPVAYAMKWCMRYIPIFVNQVSSAGIETRVNAMVERRDVARRSRTRWTPEMATIVQDLQLTLEEVRAIGLRGFGSINPPSAGDIKLRKKEHARKVRLQKGMVPQSRRTKGKCDDAVAAAIGLKGRRMIQAWRKAKILDVKLRPFIVSGVLDFAKVCPSSYGEYGAHTFVKSASATNDNAQLEQSA